MSDDRCTASIKYDDSPQEYHCDLPDGHKGPHHAWDSWGGYTWTQTVNERKALP